ncbi:hypothetical protein HMPREF9141_2329 [Prevotella multiformis DSM 16608]|uniref:Uncharacterized protein n=1 Tax=Prevotella multiformis DSM 16608 TaxID=888743 RepID=F0F9R2_9BACT|nr:hypothetical protein HMPREF9141_2329 [Prevotella multiformis DSM 16608]
MMTEQAVDSLAMFSLNDPRRFSRQSYTKSIRALNGRPENKGKDIHGKVYCI